MGGNRWGWRWRGSAGWRDSKEGNGEVGMGVGPGRLVSGLGTEAGLDSILGRTAGFESFQAIRVE